MTEFAMERLRGNLGRLKMKNTLDILDNDLERAIANKLNIVEALDHIFTEKAKVFTKQKQQIVNLLMRNFRFEQPNQAWVSPRRGLQGNTGKTGCLWSRLPR